MNAKNHNQEQHDEVVPDSTACLENSPANSRRRLLKVGISAVPIVLTLTSRPVLAWHCKTPSVAASANTSHAVLTVADPNTKTIAYWSTTAASWNPPSPFDKTTVTLLNMFGAPGDATKCKKVLDGTYTGPFATQLTKYLIAAMLNIYQDNGAMQCLSAAQIKSMFKDGPGGNYVPMSGSAVRWGSAQIIAYLQNNWIVTG